jgi:periplasmic protein TonB
MSDTTIEKIFLYFVLLSLLLHLVIFAVIVNLPPSKALPGQKPYMVELQDLPPARQKPAGEQKEVKRLDELRRRVERESAPKGERERDKIASLPLLHQGPSVEAGKPAGPAAPSEQVRNEKQGGGDFFKRKAEKGTELSKLFPSADKLALLEEGYRKKYGPEVAEGEAKFLNTDDITLGSFLRRFESAVYGVWRYPPEAARMGIEGVTPVRITFNRKGEIEKVELLASSGSKILDDEVKRTLKAVGIIGPLPRAYDKETFNLIAFFHYGIERGVIQGTLR